MNFLLIWNTKEAIFQNSGNQTTLEPIDKKKQTFLKNTLFYVPQKKKVSQYSLEQCGGEHVITDHLF